MNLSIEKTAVTATLLVLASVPAALLGYKHVYLPKKHPDTRIIQLTALASDGVWTEDSVSGANYWRKSFAAASDIHVKKGEKVLLRLASADVLHSFAIPLLGLGPIDIPAGEVREMEFVAEKPGTLVYLCWQVCSPVHEKLRGKIIVDGPAGSDGTPGSQAPADEPEL